MRIDLCIPRHIHDFVTVSHDQVEVVEQQLALALVAFLVYLKNLLRFHIVEGFVFAFDVRLRIHAPAEQRKTFLYLYSHNYTSFLSFCRLFEFLLPKFLQQSLDIADFTVALEITRNLRV